MEDSIKKEKIKVEVFQVYAKCECGGNMMFNGNVLTSYPAKYSHTHATSAARQKLYGSNIHTQSIVV